MMRLIEKERESKNNKQTGSHPFNRKCGSGSDDTPCAVRLGERKCQNIFHELFFVHEKKEEEEEEGEKSFSERR